jgi:hypothetical protein
MTALQRRPTHLQSDTIKEIPNMHDCIVVGGVWQTVHEKVAWCVLHRVPHLTFVHKINVAVASCMLLHCHVVHDSWLCSSQSPIMGTTPLTLLLLHHAAQSTTVSLLTLVFFDIYTLLNNLYTAVGIVAKH